LSTQSCTTNKINCQHSCTTNPQLGENSQL
jgi:hypothetical protein